MTAGSGILDARPMIGASAMLANTLLIPVMGVAVKKLTASGMVAADMLAWRSVLVLAVLLPFLVRRQHLRAVLSADIRAHFTHALFAVSSMFCFYYALRTLPIVTVTTVNFTTPILVLIIARPLFGERISALGWAAVLVGFLGAVLVLRPKAGGIGWDAAVLVLGSVLAAGMVLAVRRMPARSSNFAVVFYLSLFATMVYIPLVGGTPARPTAGEWPWVLLLGFIALAVHSCVTLAYRFASSLLIGALDYLRIFWAFLAGFLIFAERPDPLAAVGIALIVVSGAIVLQSSASRKAPEAAV